MGGGKALAGLHDRSSGLSKRARRLGGLIGGDPAMSIVQSILDPRPPVLTDSSATVDPIPPREAQGGDARRCRRRRS